MEILYVVYCFAFSVWFTFFIEWLISFVRYKKKTDVHNLKAMINNLLQLLIACIIQAIVALVIFFEFR